MVPPDESSHSKREATLRIGELLGASRSVLLVAPSGYGKTSILEQIEERVGNSLGRCVQTSKAQTSWARVRSHIHNFSHRTILGDPRRIFVVDDLDAFAATDGSCLSDVKKMLQDSRVSFVMSCAPAMASKMKRMRIDIVRMSGQNAMCETRVPHTWQEAVQFILQTSPPIDLHTLDECLDVFGSHMFVDTLVHNAALQQNPGNVSPYVDAIARMFPPTFHRSPESEVRHVLNLVSAAPWRGIARGQRVVKATFTNSLACCNAQASARARVATRAMDRGVSAAELCWSESCT